MKKSILESYAAVVCFAAVACGVIALGVLALSAVGIAYPEFTMNSANYARHQSNNAFWRTEQNLVFSPDKTSIKSAERPSEVELSAMREASFEQAVATELRDSKQVAVKSAIVTLIDLALFLFHWRLLARDRQVAA